ncbi:hypothetical protein [Actinoplanes sp. L3-i22]|uniref:hypothetical protein n=1 Tax=Actinoplanes sp. L3-i22 TaxID=2836373 RepID=UPI001C74A3E5|nr:hypothetical protein [Actinoplanes sp. L3-i22]BCY13717.1 hypothetical protein L3i22_088050 [Actinoplanes sp. L3-i22]
MKRGVQVSIGLAVLALLACGVPLALQEKEQDLCGDQIAEVNETVYTAHRWTAKDLPGIGDYPEVHYRVAITGGPCDRGAPASPDKAYQGVIRLRPEDAAALGADYDWTPVAAPDIRPDLAAFVPAGSAWRHSARYAEAKAAGPLRGDLYLSADGSTAYFELRTG